MKITNKGSKDYTVKVILRVESVDYTGKNGSLVTKIEDEKTVPYNQGKWYRTNKFCKYYF